MVTAVVVHLLFDSEDYPEPRTVWEKAMQLHGCRNVFIGTSPAHCGSF